MKTILLAAIAALALATTAPAFADAVHQESTGAGARVSPRTYATDGARAKAYLAAINPNEGNRVTPRVPLSDTAGLA